MLVLLRVVRGSLSLPYRVRLYPGSTIPTLLVVLVPYLVLLPLPTLVLLPLVLLGRGGGQLGDDGLRALDRPGVLLGLGELGLGRGGVGAAHQRLVPVALLAGVGLGAALGQAGELGLDLALGAEVPEDGAEDLAALRVLRREDLALEGRRRVGVVLRGAEVGPDGGLRGGEREDVGGHGWLLAAWVLRGFGPRLCSAPVPPARRLLHAACRCPASSAPSSAPRPCKPGAALGAVPAAARPRLVQARCRRPRASRLASARRPCERRASRRPCPPGRAGRGRFARRVPNTTGSGFETGTLLAFICPTYIYVEF